MNSKNIIPANIDQIVVENGIWENDKLSPIFLSALEINYKGEDKISYQLEFGSWEKLGKVNTLLHKNGIELDGYGWELFIRKFIRERNPTLEKKIKGDSESETCVLWVDNLENYISLLDNITLFINLEL